MTADYIAWIKRHLADNPHLTQTGLAKHLGVHKSIVTLMLNGKRQIKLREVRQIADYLGVPPLREEGGRLRVSIRLTAAWYLRSEMPRASDAEVAPLATAPVHRQIAAEVVDAIADPALPVGTVLVGTRLQGREKPPAGAVVIAERAQGDLVNVTVVRVPSGGLPAGVTALAVAVEARMPL